MNPLLPASAQENLVLASRSPRRIDILNSLGFEFSVDPASNDAETGVTCGDPRELPALLAERKCAQVAARSRPGSLVLAADTVVIVDDRVLTKPASDHEAERFLTALSGRSHIVVTGVVLMRPGTNVSLSASETTTVTFRSLEPEEIRRYVATGEGRDKAGSYAAQGLGSGLIRTIEGCFYNVVGLPVSLLFDMLKKVSP